MAYGFYQGEAKVHQVETFPGCEGGYAGVFDLIGNAAEFIDACDFDKDGPPPSSSEIFIGCLVAGGASPSTGAADGWIGYPLTDSNTGFRCCADTLKDASR
jgi:hypothetical protein